MALYTKDDFALTGIRRFLEPGPIVLVTSAFAGQRNVMTMGWHMMLGFSPALFACYIWDGNHSFEMLRRSRECVVNLPTSDLIEKVVGIGNCSGAETDKFERFGLATADAHLVKAPLITECYANFECRLADARQVPQYGLFIWEVVKAHVATSPKRPETLHYRGNAEFMVSGSWLSRAKDFKPQNL